MEGITPALCPGTVANFERMREKRCVSEADRILTVIIDGIFGKDEFRKHVTEIKSGQQVEIAHY